MVDDELDLTEKTPKASDDEEGDLAPPWFPKPDEDSGWELPPRVAFGTGRTIMPLKAVAAPVDVTSDRQPSLAPRELDDETPLPPPMIEDSIEIPKIDPSTLPPLPRPSASFALGTSLVQTVLPPPRARGTVPPPVRPRTESGVLVLPVPARGGSGVMVLPQQARAGSGLLPLPTKYQPHPIVQEQLFAQTDRTFAIRRRRGIDVGKIAIAGTAAVGLFVGYLAFRDDPTPHAVEPARPQARVATPTVTSIAPAVQAPVAEIAPHAPVALTQAVSKPAAELPKLHVPITSNPDGALVTLVDDGKASVLGTTPLFVTIDQAHSYDVVLVLKGHPTTVRHLDSRSTHEISIDLRSGAPTTPRIATASAAPQIAHAAPAAAHPATPTAPQIAHAAPTAAHPATPMTPQIAHATPAAAHPATAPAAPQIAHAAPAAAHPATAPAQAARPAQSQPARTAPPAPQPAAARTLPVNHTAPPQRVAVAAPVPAPKLVAGNGVLMVSAKPPCQIAIDGKMTKLVTPQRALAMPAGNHKITLVNPQQRINRTLDVKIVAGQPTKLIQDFTKN